MVRVFLTWPDDRSEIPLNVIIGFEDVLSRHNKVENATLGDQREQQLTLNISIGSENEQVSGRNYSNAIMPELGSASASGLALSMFLVPKFVVKELPVRLLWSFDFGDWSSARGRTHKRIYYCLLIAILIVSPAWDALHIGSRVLKVPDPGRPGDDAPTTTLIVRDPVATFASAIGVVLMWLLFSVRCCTPLLRRTMFTFDSLYIMINEVIAHTAVFGERFMLLQKHNELTVALACAEIVNSLSSVLGITFIAANADAFLFSRCLKATAFALLIFWTCVFYARQRYFMSWSSVQVCAWTHCTTPLGVFLVAQCNVIVFYLRMLVAWCSGKHFATLRTSLRLLGSYGAAYAHASTPKLKRARSIKPLRSMSSRAILDAIASTDPPSPSRLKHNSSKKNLVGNLSMSDPIATVECISPRSQRLASPGKPAALGVVSL